MNGYTLALNPSVAPNVKKYSVVRIIRTHTRKHARLVHISEIKLYYVSRKSRKLLNTVFFKILKFILLSKD